MVNPYRIRKRQPKYKPSVGDQLARRKFITESKRQRYIRTGRH